MGTMYPEVLDISSDEEDGFCSDRGDWIASLLDPVEKEDSDEVIVIDEVHGNCMYQEKSKPTGKVDMDDDDDCLILDGDPDKPIELANDTGNESDELQVVGEKGQIACRDYPHPRHLCAKFPFSTNPHEKYCDLCHCYVCEIRAPCSYWGTGVSNSDHCHSSDKEDVWKVQRKWVKCGKIAPLPTPKHMEKSVPSLHKPTPALTIPPPLNTSSPVLQTIPKSNTLRACSSASKFGVPSIISQRSNQTLGDSLGSHRLRHHGISRSASLPGSAIVTSNFARRDRGSGGNNLGPRFVSPHVNFKRGGSGGATLTMTRPGNGARENSRVHSNYLLQQQQQSQHLPFTYNDTSRSHQLKACQPASQQEQMNHYSPVTCSDIHSPRSQELYVSQTTSQPNTGGSLMDSLSYGISLLPQVYNQPIPSPSENQNAYLPQNPTPKVPNQNQSDFQPNWLMNETVQSFATSAENPELESVQPTSEPPPPLTEPIPQADVNLVTEFDLENWIQSLVHRPDLEAGNVSISSSLGYIPPQGEHPEAGLSFDFESSL